MRAVPLLPDVIRARLTHAGLSLDSSAVERLDTYFGLLTKWNRTVNLTALALDPPSDAAIDRLLVEPYLAAQHVRAIPAFAGHANPLRLLDVGSGGGSPAIPLSLALGAELTMVESRTRKAAFLRQAIRELRLPSADVLNVRLENLQARSEFHKAFDLVSIRAVRADRGLWEAISTLIRKDGRVLWFRSADEPLAGIHGFDVESVQPLVPNSELALLRRSGDDRQLIVSF